MAKKPEESLLVPLRKLLAAEQFKMLSDEQLLQCFVAQREEGVFAALVKRHGSMVLGVCRSVLRHTQDAEDVCQACFLLLARNPGLDPQQRLSRQLASRSGLPYGKEIGSLEKAFSAKTRRRRGAR